MCAEAADIQIKCVANRHIGKNPVKCANENCEKNATVCRSCGFVSAFRENRKRGLICPFCMQQEKSEGPTRVGSLACSDVEDNASDKGRQRRGLMRRREGDQQKSQQDDKLMKGKNRTTRDKSKKIQYEQMANDSQSEAEPNHRLPNNGIEHEADAQDSQSEAEQDNRLPNNGIEHETAPINVDVEDEKDNAKDSVKKAPMIEEETRSPIVTGQQ